jgi:hypothetical protein
MFDRMVASYLVRGGQMLELIGKIFARRPTRNLAVATRMTRVTWIAIEQGRVRSAFEP